MIVAHFDRQRHGETLGFSMHYQSSAAMFTVTKRLTTAIPP
jgi:hypothetical protein